MHIYYFNLHITMSSEMTWQARQDENIVDNCFNSLFTDLCYNTCS